MITRNPEAELLEAALNDFLTVLRSRVDNATLESLPHLIRDGTPIDYDEFAEAFAIHYLWPNAIKARGALVNSAIYGRRLLDIGSGIGSATLGAMLACPNVSLMPDAVQMVDQSYRQLELASELFDFLRLRLVHVPHLEVLHADIAKIEFSDLLSTADLVLASHVLSENSDLAEVLTSGIGKILPPHCALVVIEQRDDPYWVDVIEGKSLPDAAIQVSGSVASIVLNDSTPVVVPKQTWRARWVVIRTAPAPWMGDLVRSYFQAWNDRDPDQVSAIFTPGAIYRDKPFAPEMKGRKAIVKYWRDVVHDSLIKVNASPVRIVFDGPSAWIQFEASLLQHDNESVLIDGAMRMAFDPDTERISELREVFRTSAATDR